MRAGRAATRLRRLSMIAHTMKSLPLATLLLAASLAGPTLAADVPAPILHAMADATRPQTDRNADALRDPADTIAFAGVKPGMVVGELFPGGGYYTRLLSGVVGPTGKIYALETTRWKSSLAVDQKMAAEPGRGNVVVTGTAFGEFSLPEKIDLFWITQNYHDLHIAEYGSVDMLAFNRHVFDSLKPGGTYFIVDHQANPGITAAEMAVLHRIEKAQVIAEVTAAGFKLVGESAVLHRTDDDHTKPIFDLHGKTDQYLLKFVRP
jgi:predicted methyltransferase